jgi:hypothetical protein
MQDLFGRNGLDRGRLEIASRYLRSLGIEQVREALEEGLKKPAKVIKFRKKRS